jgi:hypothetical protein
MHPPVVRKSRDTAMVTIGAALMLIALLVL